MDRPIVVNSLLCFIHNFRSHPLLNALTQRYFSKGLYDTAHNTLIEILSDQTKDNDEEVEFQDSTLIELFDKVISTLNPSPLFVAADLTTLPMVLISDQNQSKSVLDEIHQLRFYIQSTFSAENQTFVKKFPSCYFSALSNNIITNDSNSSNEKEMASSDRASPINLSTHSRESPSLRISELQHQQQSNGGENNECLSQANSPVSTPRKQHLNRHAPYRLEKAVRKLTDRIEATKDTTESPKKSSSTPPPMSTSSATTITPTTEDGTSNRSTSAELLPSHDTSSTTSIENQKPSEDLSVATSVGSELSFLNTPTLNGHFDPITFMMLKNIATNQQAFKNHAIKSCSRNSVSDTISVDPSSIDEIDDDDKMSNESSPTPSDSSNGKEYKSESEKHNGSGKPFTCTQPNCTKSFANKFLLKKHQFIHTGLRPHICPYCAKRFNRKDNLLRHKKTHLANAALQIDGRRRHHALLAPAPITPGTFDPLALLKISPTRNNNEESEGVKYEAISP
jgi:uncharacterized Zn-finger protein